MLGLPFGTHKIASERYYTVPTHSEGVRVEWGGRDKISAGARSAAYSRRKQPAL